VLISVTSYGREAYPSITTIAADCGIDPSKVSLSLSRLKAYLEKFPDKRGNTYRQILNKVFPPVGIPTGGNSHGRGAAIPTGGNQTDQRTDQERLSLAREGDRRALDEFQPDAAMDDWAAKTVPELSNPRDPAILAKFKAHHRANSKYPKDCAAAYQLWILREVEFAKKHARAWRNDRPLSDCSPLIETLLKEASRTDDD
jgi:hypothetical protein